MMEVLDDEEAGPSKAQGQYANSHGCISKACDVVPSHGAQVANAQHHWADVGDGGGHPSILGWMRGMESEVARMLENLAEMKEGLADA